MFWYVDFISFYSIFVPVLVSFFYFRRVLKTTKLLITYVFVTCIIEVAAAVFFSWNMNNLFTFHLHTFAEFILLSLIFIRLLRSPMIKTFAQFLLYGVTVFGIVSILFYQGILEFNSLHRHVEGTVLIFYLLIYFNEQRKYIQDSFWDSPYNLFCSVLMLYFVGNFFVFIFGNFMFSSGDDSAWVIHGILNTLLNLTMAYVITRSVSKPKRFRI